MKPQGVDVRDVTAVLRTMCEDIDTPRALTVAMMVDAGDLRQLCELRCDPKNYLDPETYFRDACVTEFLRKCDGLPGLPTVEELESKARSDFLAIEKSNCLTNVRLSRFLPNGLLDPEDIPLASFVAAWRKKVRRVLGALPRDLVPLFSQGATVSDPSERCTLPDKLTSTSSSYQGVGILDKFWYETRAGMRRDSPEIVRGNRFFTVEKDSMKRRSCCVEAKIPISLQLAIGSVITSRIERAFGVHMNASSDTTYTQRITVPEYHRTFAQHASVSGDFATIDLSNASDTIAKKLVELVLPSEWYEVLDSLRAKVTSIDIGEPGGPVWVVLEKFSSMGNGFTFPLETLLFWTLMQTVADATGADASWVSCFGDDIIVPSSMAAEAIAALRFFGFTPNERKSFTDGYFRESCGGDFFAGVGVRPHYVKELPDEPQKWISLANGLRRMASGHSSSSSRWNYLKRAWAQCLAHLPNNIRRCRGPSWLGDIVIHVPDSEWIPRTRLRKTKAYGAYVTEKIPHVRSYTPIPVVLSWNHWWPDVQLTSAVLGARSRGVTPRDGVVGYRLDWTAVNVG